MPNPNPTLPPPPLTLSLCLITYDRGPHPLTNAPRPHHWAYYLDTTTTTHRRPGGGTAAGADSEQERGTIFQLRGMPGGFYYPGPEDAGMGQGGEVGGVVGKLEVGEVRVGEVGVGGLEGVVDEGGVVDGEGGKEADADAVLGVVQMIDGVLREVGVVVDESAAWNCQDWALEGLERLKKVGVVREDLERGRVKAWLAERW